MLTRRAFHQAMGGLMTGAAVFALGQRRALAQPKPDAPAEKVILTITGQIADKTGHAVFDRSKLEALGLVAFETATPWYATRVKFEGVSMAALLRAVGASGEMLSVTALNDYKTEIPIEDFEKFGTILALKRDGNYLPVSDKGPLFIVYPFDQYPELKAQKFYSRSAWQVARMEVK